MQRLWSLGHRAPHICVALGTTRSSVTHKIARLGLQSMPSNPTIPDSLPAAVPPPEAAVHIVVSPFDDMKNPAEVFPSPQPGLVSSRIPLRAIIDLPDWPWKPAKADGLTLMQLNEMSCRYPFGQPKSPMFRFCGKPKLSGSYCAEHAKLCYQSAANRAWMNRKSVYIKKVAKYGT